jgi:hypothetical protein
MSKVIKEIKPVYGKLFVGDRDYYLLEPEPVKPNKVIWVQNDVLTFYVRNHLGFATFLRVRGDFLIDEFYKSELEVSYHIDAEDELEVDDDRIINALNEVQDKELPF